MSIALEISVNASEMENQRYSSRNWWLGQKAYEKTLETLEDKCRRAAYDIKKIYKNQGYAEVLLLVRMQEPFRFASLAFTMAPNL